MTTTIMMPQSSAIKRGDLVVVYFPSSDLTTGKIRPTLIVQTDGLDTGLPQVVAVMISSQLRRANHPSRVLIRKSTPIGQQSGLIHDSVIMTDNIATIVWDAIERVIGSIPMDDIDIALRHTLGLEESESSIYKDTRR